MSINYKDLAESQDKEIQRLENVNRELTKALAGIDITYAVRRKDKTVFINAHVSQEVHDLLWRIKEMRGEG